jgi:hypothetical protein
MFEDVKAGDEAWQKRALAIDKNLLLGHRRHWTDRVRNKIVVFSSATWSASSLKG